MAEAPAKNLHVCSDDSDYDNSVMLGMRTPYHKKFMH